MNSRAGEVLIRLYEPDDEIKIVNLLRQVFDEWPRFNIPCDPIEHWIWKFLDNPIAKSIITIGLSGDEAVCCLLNIPRNFKIGDRVLKVGDALDAAVHPDYRRKGLYSKMIAVHNEMRLQDDTFIVCSLGSHLALIRSYRRRGSPELPSPPRILIRIKDVNLHLKEKNVSQRWLKKTAYETFSFIRRLFEGDRKNIHFNNFRVEKVDCFDSKYRVFWHEIRDHYEFILERSPEFMKWRYCDPRGGEYVLYQAEEDGKVVGFCVLRVNYLDPDYPEGYIVDLLALPDRDDIVEAIIQHAVHFFDSQNLNVVRVMCLKGHPVERIYRNYGFINSRRELMLSLRTVDPSRQEELEFIKEVPLDKMDYQYANTDWI